MPLSKLPDIPSVHLLQLLLLWTSRNNWNRQTNSNCTHLDHRELEMRIFQITFGASSLTTTGLLTPMTLFLIFLQLRWVSIMLGMRFGTMTILIYRSLRSVLTNQVKKKTWVAQIPIFSMIPVLISNILALTSQGNATTLQQLSLFSQSSDNTAIITYQKCVVWIMLSNSYSTENRLKHSKRTFDLKSP